MQTIPIQDLEQQAKEKGCPLYMVLDEIVEKLVKKKVRIKIRQPIKN